LQRSHRPPADRGAQRLEMLHREKHRQMGKDQAGSKLRILAPIDSSPARELGVGNGGNRGAAGAQQIARAEEQEATIARDRIAGPGERVERKEEQEESCDQPTHRARVLTSAHPFLSATTQRSLPKIHSSGGREASAATLRTQALDCSDAV